MEKKNLVMVCLCAVIAIMAVAYAAFSTTLTVDGSVSASGTFNVHYVQVGEGKCTATVTKGLTASSGTITTAGGASANLAVQLVTPGDEVQCTVKVLNEGTISAKLVGEHTISNTSLNANSTPIAVTVSSNKSTLTPNEDDTITVNVKYNWNEETQPGTTTTGAFTITSNYEQAF